MQYRLTRYLRSSVFFALACLMAYMSAANASPPAPDSEKLALSTADSDRLMSVIDMVDSGLIHQDMKLAEVENLFQRKSAEGLPSPGSLGWFLVPLANTPKRWYMVFRYDELGVVKNYKLTNHDQKLGPLRRTAPAAAEINTVATNYKNATTDGERLKVCIAAVNTEVIETRAPISNITKVFGESWRQEQPRNDLKIYSVPISVAPDGWRLFFSVYYDTIDQYYLSKIRPAQYKEHHLIGQ